MMFDVIVIGRSSEFQIPFPTRCSKVLGVGNGNTFYIIGVAALQQHAAFDKMHHLPATSMYVPRGVSMVFVAF
jgi:hypothetical protein